MLDDFLDSRLWLQPRNRSVASSPTRFGLSGLSGLSRSPVLVDCWGTARCTPPAPPAPPALPALRPPRHPPRRVAVAAPASSSITPASSLSESRCSSRRARRRGRRPAKQNARQRVTPVSDTSFSSGWPWSALGEDLLLVPEHDRRILEMMALKRQQEELDAEVAHRAHRAWERERERRRKEDAEREAKWRAGVSARRQWEARESSRRMEAMKRSLRLAQLRLQEALRLKEERVQLRLLEESVNKLVLQRERTRELDARRAEADAKRLELERLELSHRALLDREVRARRDRADSKRRAARDSQRLRAASANREWARCRLERASLLALQAEEGARALRAACRERHQRAHANTQRQRRGRRLRALQASLERDSRQLEARALHDHLELGLQLWRERCAALQEGAARRAQERAKELREAARARVQRSNQRRRGHHRAILTRMVAEEQVRQRAQRNEIRDKDQRIGQLRRRKERALEAAREQAYATASLREELRRTLSPETFDRKAARVELEMRVSGCRASAGGSPSPTARSHICLG